MKGHPHSEAETTLISLQAAIEANPDDEALRDTFRQQMANWSHLEDCLMEDMDDA